MGATNGIELKPVGRPAQLALANLTPRKDNRDTSDDEKVRELALSIKTVGLLQPLTVERDPENEGGYIIHAGVRRFRAMKLLKVSIAPCVIIKRGGNSPDPDILSVVENHQRLNLTPLEEAAAVRGLLDLGLETEAVARSLGRSRKWVLCRSRLTDLSESWLVALKDETGTIRDWPPSHLEMIARFPAEVQDRILEDNRARWKWQIPTIAEVERATGEFLHLLRAAPWNKDDATLCPQAGACSACPKRSSHQPELFEDDLPRKSKGREPGDACLDPACWEEKAEAFLLRKAEVLKGRYPDLVIMNGVPDRDPASLKEAHGVESVNAWEIVESKKGDSKARPALVIDGPGLGRVKWIKLPKVARGETSEGQLAKANGSSQHPQAERTIEEKKEPYDKRRRQLVVDAVKARIQALADESDPAKTRELEGGGALLGAGLVPKALGFLAAMLREHGWRTSAGGDFDWPEELSWETILGTKSHEIGRGEVRAATEVIAWRLLHLALQKYGSRLAVAPGERDNRFHYDDAERISRMLGIDFAALRSQAAEALPYAKSWRDETMDAWAPPSNGEEAGATSPSRSVASQATASATVQA